MSLLALLMGAIMSGSTVIEYGKQPLDYDIVEQVSIEQPYLTGRASWYDYNLTINGEEREWSKTHNTCAMRNKVDRYKTFKVCSKVTGKCVDCYLNDYGPKEYTNRVIDLSSHAFKELGIPLSRGVAEVEIFIL